MALLQSLYNTPLMIRYRGMHTIKLFLDHKRISTVLRYLLSHSKQFKSKSISYTDIQSSKFESNANRINSIIARETMVKDPIK